MIELYGCGSPNVFKVMYMLAETGLPWTLRRVKVSHGDQFEPAFVAMNPNSKVPVIVDTDGPGGQPHTVFESGAILLYLAEKTGRGLPDEPAARSRAMQWLMLQMASVGPQFGQALHFTYIAPDTPYARQRYVTEVNRLYDVYDAHLASNAWLAGPAFSVADIAAFPWLAKYVRTLSIDLASRPHVARWIADFQARPWFADMDAQAKALFKEDAQAQKDASPAQLDRFFGRTGWAAAAAKP